jgi:biopolymer transport protein ExbD
MAITFASAAGDEDEVVSAINTTPLVDVMLVLLIIFLITVPVVTHTVAVSLPKDANQPTQTTPQTITLAVTRDGDMFWNQQAVPDIAALMVQLKKVAVLTPQPAIHIRGDQGGRYEFVGKVVLAVQRAGISKIAFITEPPHGG